jgi:hypothetical protein
LMVVELIMNIINSWEGWNRTISRQRYAFFIVVAFPHGKFVALTQNWGNSTLSPIPFVAFLTFAGSERHVVRKSLINTKMGSRVGAGNRTPHGHVIGCLIEGASTHHNQDEKECQR